jgi:hypothetical protein
MSDSSVGRSAEPFPKIPKTGSTGDSVSGPAAIHGQCDAGDTGGGITGEENGYIADALRWQQRDIVRFLAQQRPSREHIVVST